ncbi:MAG: hypothetical protein HRU14_06320 [Planctomycetes bacterium]|nr:hypothetical protein [Planctomycetota bacterium]
MRTLTLSIALVCALAPVAPSQAYAYHPSTNPLTSQSNNNYPFGAGAPYGFRFVNHIPASALDPANPYITDVSFFSPFNGTWASGSVKVAIGHLVDPPPCPFTFPDGAGGTGIGSFTDLTILWDGTTDGPLSFNVTQDQWNPLGLAASGRPPFQWNGIDPIGFFIRRTGQNITGTTRMTSSSSVFRTFASNASPGGCIQTGGLFIRMHLSCGGTSWQVNSPLSSMDVDGVTNDACSPIRVASCVGTTSTLNVSSTNLGLPYEIGISQLPGVAVGSGAQVLANGEIINLDLGDPSLYYLYGLSFSVPFTPFSATFSYPAPVSLSAQMANVDPSMVPGIAVSALTEYAASLPAATIDLTPSLGLDGFQQLFLNTPPFCGSPIMFYGTTYDSLFVNANGFVSFNGGDSWWAADPAYWATMMPRIGVWTDFDSQLTGGVYAGATGTSVVVNYVNVPENTYGGPTGPQTSFNIEFDTLTGSCAITGLTPGAGHGTATLAGITPGAPSGSMAGDPGSTAFSSVLGLGLQAGPGGNNMLYEFVAGGMPSGWSNIVFLNGDASLYTVY